MCSAMKQMVKLFTGSRDYTIVLIVIVASDSLVQKLLTHLPKTVDGTITSISGTSPLSLPAYPSDYYMNGIKSVHDDSREDRLWSIKCCRSIGYRTESCELERGYINSFHGTIDYAARLSGCAGDNVQSFFTGLYSYHDNQQE